MNLPALVEKSTDADLLREMIGFAAGRLMEMEIGAATDAGYRKKSLLWTTSTTASGIGRRVLASWSVHPMFSCAPLLHETRSSISAFPSRSVRRQNRSALEGHSSLELVY